MTKELFFSASPHETKVALLEDDQVVEVYYQRDTDVGLVGGIYKGRVSRVLPGMQSAFVNIGLERDAFLYVSDFLEDSEEYDRVFAEAETRVARYTEEAEKSATAGQQEPALAARPAVTSSTEVTRPTEAGEKASEAASVEPGAREPSAAVVPTASLTSSATVPVETSVPPVAVAATPVSPARPEPPEHRHSDYRRRRRGRRGRGFRPSRFTSRAERHQDAGRSEYAAPPTFEVLPGESLAKHSQTTSEIPQGPAPVFASPELMTSQTASFQPAPSEPRSLGSVAASLAPVFDASQTHSPDEHSAKQNPVAAFTGDEPRREQVTALATSWDAAAGTHCGSAIETAGRQQSVASPSSSATVSPQPESREEDDEEFPERAPESYRDTATVTDEAGTAAAEAAGESEFPGAEHASAEGPRVSTQGAERAYTLRDSSQRPRFASRRGRRGRGGFGRRYTRPEGTSVREPSRPGNDHPVQIAELLKEGQEILVQIAKEPLGTKGARITSHIALPGRYLVYMPTITHIGVSRKIASEEERFRLRNIISENRGSLTGGFIVRTAGAGRSEEELRADLNFLSNLWSEIRTRAERTKAPALLHSDLTLVQRILRDTLSPDFKTVRVDNEIEYERAIEFVNRCQPSLVGHVKLYTRETPLFEEFGIQQEIDKALKPKVWLRSGGYIVINQTEALVAIDVNTGKYVGKTNRLEDTIVKTNVDAVQEIVRQIRLRDLGGIIVIDFIDMDDRRNRQKVVQALEEALSADRAPTKILSFNEFGLVALTRKRVKQSLERTLCQPCPYCSGAGWVKSVGTICNEILAEARRMAQQIEGDTMTLRLNPEVARALKLREGEMLSEFESITKKDIIIKSDPNIHQERFEIF
jgi:ribonuclease G